MILELFYLDDEVALVAGSSQGPGQAAALALAQAGADIALLDRATPKSRVRRCRTGRPWRSCASRSTCPPSTDPPPGRALVRPGPRAWSTGSQRDSAGDPA